MEESEQVGRQQNKSEGSLTKEEHKPVERSQNILKSLRIIFNAIRAHAKSVEKKTGINSTQLWMLWEIFNTPGLKVTKLAGILSIHQTTCSNMLDKLQQKDLIRRDRGGPDQRVVHIYLTEKGSRLLDHAPQPTQGVIFETLLRMPDDVVANVEDSLGKLVGALQLDKKDAALKPIDL